MEILVLTPTPSHPQNQGNRKGVHAFTKEFQKRGARIHFLYVPTEWYGGFSPDEHIAMSREWDIFHAIPLKDKWQFKPSDTAMGVDDVWDDYIDITLRWWRSGVRFDAVVCHYVFLSKALELFPDSTYKILYTHDRFSDRRDMLLENGLGAEYFYTSQAEEKKAFDRADLVVAVKEEEAEFFRTLTDRDVVTIGHFGTPHELEQVPGQSPVLRVGFIGSENSINIKNLTEFFDRFLPVFEARSDIQFRVAGKICDRWSVESPVVEMMGRVDSLLDFYEHVDLVFIPFEFSTGIKIKAIEAMAHGLGVVMTRNAAEGIPTDYPLHTCADQEAVCQALLEIADNRKTVTDLASQSHDVYGRLRADIEGKIDAIFARLEK